MILKLTILLLIMNIFSAPFVSEGENRIGATDPGNQILATDEENRIGATDQGNRTRATDEENRIGAKDQGNRIRATDERNRIRACEAGIRVGLLEPGELNMITDVAGVRVGHHTLKEGGHVRTGVTAILPHSGNLFTEKVPAAIHCYNGFGKLAGYLQVRELGNIETPVVLTTP